MTTENRREAHRPQNNRENSSSASPSEWLSRPAEITSEQKAVMHTHLVNTFSDWLSKVLNGDSPPEGINREILCELSKTPDIGAMSHALQDENLFQAFSNLTTLSREIKLQGRAFKELSDQTAELKGVKERIDSIFNAHNETLSGTQRIEEQVRSILAQQEEDRKHLIKDEAQKELFTVLMDIRDRLKRGLETAELQLQTHHEAPRTAGIFGKLFHSFSAKQRSNAALDAAKALKEGCALTLGRIDEAMQRLGITEIPSQGRPFDPHCMEAAEVETTSKAANGTVVEVFRAGYRRHEEVLRSASVKVAKAER